MRRGWRSALKGIAIPVVALLAIPAAWVACNGPWADAPPQPVAAELRLRPPVVAPERNLFFDMQGMGAPEGADLHAVGLASMQGSGGGQAQWLSWPSGPLWQCRPVEQDCVALWRAQAVALRVDFASAAVLGRRCEQLAGAEAFEEPPFERPASGPLASVPWADLPLPSFAGLTRCTRWLAMQAALERDPVLAQRRLGQADRLARLALSGSRTLIGTMIGVVAVQSNWLFTAQLAAAGGVERAALPPLLAPLPSEALSPRHWALEEARFGRELMRDMAHAVRKCGAGSSLSDEPAVPWLERLMCRNALGVLPELSVQSSDARWLARLATVPPQGPASCEQLSQPVWREAGTGWPAWRNTLGRRALDSPAGANFALYAARQADLELLRQTLLAQVLGQSTPGAVQLTREAGAQRFAACRARLFPGEHEATLRLPLL
jgi:hypothetical protein